ncbi:ATP-binding protein [Oribacterium sinus]|uniref:DNA replication protein DnaC n=1 Tax=Oribacterium sinus F0268 TaxID=585501 RepID=C2L0N8_9FIRM|nr:ATP-binding protein [Oribacterium sinus]EEJ50411.1 DNA replication protein DnaC [Oribacterium sinus F0268]
MALNNGQVQEIQRILSERQLEAHRRYLEKREEIFRKLPELEELEEKVRAFSLSVAGEMQQGNREGLLRLKEEIGKLHKEKKALLEGAGYKIQDLEEEEHFCPLCQDTGYVDGKKCQCFLKLQGELLYRQSRMGAVLERENFSKFQLERFDNIEKLGQCGNKTLREYIKEIRDYLTNYCEEYPKNNRSILFTGSTGTGKTYFLHSIAKALLDRGVSVLYFTATGLFEYFSKRMREEDTEDYIEEVDVILIDDLGTEFSNSFTTSRFFALLNQRILDRKTMLISTNLNFKELREMYSDRVVSRFMSDYEIIPLYGKDQRL